MQKEFTNAGTNVASELNQAGFFSEFPHCVENYWVEGTAQPDEKGKEDTGFQLFSQDVLEPKDVLVSKAETPCVDVEESGTAQLHWDCENLAATQLREKYPAEANSHRNMMSRQKSKGAIVHPDFRKFRGFLKIMGARPAVCTTVDRINNKDPEYAPGKARWADKRTQNSNKGDSLVFNDPKTGKAYTVARLAKLQNVQPNSIRRRFAKGWSDEEIIAGTRGKTILLPKLSWMSPGPIFGPRPGEPTWTGLMSKAEAKNDQTKIAELQVWKRQYDHWSERHRIFRKINPDSFEDLFLPCDMLNADLVKRYGYEPMSEDEWLERFAEDWPVQRPHIIFERCSREHQEAIEAVDPEYVKRHREALALLSKPD